KFIHTWLRFGEIMRGSLRPLRGKYLTVGCPMKFSAFTPDIKAAPLLGEHTAAVLQELGYSDDEIAAMKQNHAI
ncbi:hypothetical protein HEO81_021155, partial [Escherichia coli]|nr:hypothetical protein [Escherichia coli]